MCAANWRSSEWTVEFPDVDKLLDMIKQIPNRSEKVINESLRATGGPWSNQNIQQRIPISEKRKMHAHNYKLRVNYENLGFTVRPAPRFNYIKYPDLAIGTSVNNPPKRFMRKGLEAAMPRISQEINKAVGNEINKTLKG